jgi:hypothetical protein
LNSIGAWHAMRHIKKNKIVTGGFDFQNFLHGEVLGVAEGRGRPASGMTVGFACSAALLYVGAPRPISAGSSGGNGLPLTPQPEFKITLTTKLRKTNTCFMYLLCRSI